jgi:hypothetical protein
VSANHQNRPDSAEQDAGPPPDDAAHGARIDRLFREAIRDLDALKRRPSGAAGESGAAG